MNLQRYVRQLDPQRLSGAELATLRTLANEFVKSGNEKKVQAGALVLKLLNHIDHITLEALNK